MKKIKVLVVDEDILARQAVANVLQNEPGMKINVSGDMDNIEEIVCDLNPDVLLLNIEHPENDEFHILKTLKARHPELPIVVLTSRTEKGAARALYALRHGAMDFITKPEQNSLLLFAGRHLVKRLRPTLEVATKLAEKERTKREIAKTLEGVQQNFEEFTAKGQDGDEHPLSIVAIGASTGGPKALFSIIPGLPHDLPVPVVIVQHLPRHYTKELAKSLNEVSEIQVDEAYDGVELTPGTVWLAPGGYHAEVERNGMKTFLKLHRGPRENGVRPSIDLLFRSAGRTLGRGVLGVILSGCGSDGIAGIRSIREHGGKVLVQDPRTALAASLPLSVIQAGLADNYYPVEQISDQIVKRSFQKPEKPDQQDRKENKREFWHANRGDYMGFRNFEF